jgi:hypothetical protein
MTTRPDPPAAGPTPTSPFGPEVVAAVVSHMNADHAADNLAICRAATGEPALRSAQLRTLDRAGLVFDAEGPGGSVAVVVPWRREIVERADIRLQVTEMALEARPEGAAEPHQEH